MPVSQWAFSAGSAMSAVQGRTASGPPCAMRTRSAGTPAATTAARTASTSSGCVAFRWSVVTRPTTSCGFTSERQASVGGRLAR